MKDKCMWVWNLWKQDIPKFIKLIKEKNINKIFLNYTCYNKEILTEINKNCVDLNIVPLIGDAKNELCAESIIKIISKNKYDRVHLDIEKNKSENILSYCTKLMKVLDYLKSNNIYCEFDVECWNHNKHYKDIVDNLPDELHLMSYSKWALINWLRTLRFRNKPYYVGIETNKRLFFVSTNIPDKHAKWFDKINANDENYKGTSIHCWGFYE